MNKPASYINPVIHNSQFIIHNLILIIVLCSCHKDHDTKTYPVNHLEATISFNSGNTVQVNETGEKVRYNHGLLVAADSISAIDSQNRVVSFYTVRYNDIFWQYEGFYYTNYLAANDSLYNAHFDTNNGQVAYTYTDGTYHEGTFNFTCIYPGATPDTVRVIGSFKVNFIE